MQSAEMNKGKDQTIITAWQRFCDNPLSHLGHSLAIEANLPRAKKHNWLPKCSVHWSFVAKRMEEKFNSRCQWLRNRTFSFHRRIILNLKGNRFPQRSLKLENALGGRLGT